MKPARMAANTHRSIQGDGQNPPESGINDSRLGASGKMGLILKFYREKDHADGTIRHHGGDCPYPSCISS